MAYVSVPKDLSAVKEKLLFNLTRRQLICFCAGLLVALPLFFLCKRFLNVSAAALIMIVSLLPFMLFALYEKNGQPFETVLRNIIQVSFLRPKVRPYQTNNFYEALERQDRLDREVYQIVRKGKIQPRRSQTDQRGYRKGQKTGQRQQDCAGQHPV